MFGRAIFQAFIFTVWGVLLAGDLPAGDFRQATWGMNEEEVRAGEEDSVLNPGAPPGQLSYDGVLLGKLKVRITYWFEGGKLVRGGYTFSSPLRVKDFEMLRSVLTRKYGPPRSDASSGGIDEVTWLTAKTEIDLEGRGSSSRGAAGDGSYEKVEINYYDRNWCARSIKKTAEAEAGEAETERFRDNTIGGWVQVPFGYVWDDDYWKDF